VSDQDQALAGVGRTCRVDHAGQVMQVVITLLERAFVARRAAMPAVVIAQRMPALLVQVARHVGIAANVLTQTVHDHGDAFGGLRVAQGPELGDQAQAITGADGGGEACKCTHEADVGGCEVVEAARSQLKPALVPARGRYSQPIQPDQFRRRSSSKMKA
jgi:hypothetical protein